MRGSLLLGASKSLTFVFVLAFIRLPSHGLKQVMAGQLKNWKYKVSASTSGASPFLSSISTCRTRDIGTSSLAHERCSDAR